MIRIRRSGRGVGTGVTQWQRGCEVDEILDSIVMCKGENKHTKLENFIQKKFTNDRDNSIAFNTAFLFIVQP